MGEAVGIEFITKQGDGPSAFSRDIVSLQKFVLAASCTLTASMVTITSMAVQRGL